MPAKLLEVLFLPVLNGQVFLQQGQCSRFGIVSVLSTHCETHHIGNCAARSRPHVAVRTQRLFIDLGERRAPHLAICHDVFGSRDVLRAALRQVRILGATWPRERWPEDQREESTASAIQAKNKSSNACTDNLGQCRLPRAACTGPCACHCAILDRSHVFRPSLC